MIEVMGLAVLPARLKHSLERIHEEWLAGHERLPEDLQIHEAWYESLRRKYDGLTGEAEVKRMIRDEVGHVFKQVLTDSGVFKRDEQGLSAFDKFSQSVIKTCC